MTNKARNRGAPRANAGRREARINALAVKVVAALVVLYMIGVAGFFVYDHLL